MYVVQAMNINTHYQLLLLHVLKIINYYIAFLCFNCDPTHTELLLGLLIIIQSFKILYLWAP